MTTLNRSVLPLDEEQLHNRTHNRQGLNLEPVAAPAKAPNIVIVLIDDMGFGASSAFGGPCEMPAAERLAKGGLKYTRFHTTALCSPTRQALLTGRNHHAVNMGNIIELATPVRGYTSVRPDSAAPLAQVLKMNGYSTAAFGKWHQTPAWEAGPTGPFDHWPTGEGFEHFYGFISAEMNQWQPVLVEGTAPVEPPEDPGYHLSQDTVTKAIGWLDQQRTLTPDKPFFLYVPFGATHSPHHAPKSFIEKYKGRFDAGWDAERERIVAAQRKLGVVPADCPLTARHGEIPAWSELSAEQKKVATRLMETYAGFAEHTDAQVGRLVDALEQLGVMDNTLFFYILGDNGASGEGGIHGTMVETADLNGFPDTVENLAAKLDDVGTPRAYNHYPVGWAHAMDTPYQWTKQIASHWGGTRVGMVVHWPRGIHAHGEVRNQWHHVIDIVPTILEATHLPQPKVVNGVVQQRMDGVSMAYSFNDRQAADRHHTQYFEMIGNRGIYHDGWTACTKHATPWEWGENLKLPAFEDDLWELYGPDDWSQMHDLAAEMPEKLHELQELFLQEAANNNVLPLDDRRGERFNPELAGRPDLLRGRTEMTLRPDTGRLIESAFPNVKNNSHSLEARVTLGHELAQGVLVAQGDRFTGWTFYLIDGRPAYTYNWFGRHRYDVKAAQAIGAGEHTIRFEFTIDDGEGHGRGGVGRILIDGKEVARGRIEKTVPFLIGIACFASVGRDVGAPVIDDYRTPHGAFSGGTLHDVHVTLAGGGGSAVPDGAAARITMAGQ